jgi:hypothetical protein
MLNLRQMLDEVAGRACPQDHGDVANQRSDLDLLADRNLLVVLLLPVKVEQDRVAEGADRGETRRMNTFTSSEFLRTCYDFLAGFEHDDKGALPAGLMEQSNQGQWALAAPTPPP